MIRTYTRTGNRSSAPGGSPHLAYWSRLIRTRRLCTMQCSLPRGDCRGRGGRGERREERVREERVKRREGGESEEEGESEERERTKRGGKEREAGRRVEVYMGVGMEVGPPSRKGKALDQCSVRFTAMLNYKQTT